MELSDKRMGEIALLYVINKVKTEQFSFHHFQNRVRYTAAQLGISEDEAMAFVSEIFKRAEHPNIPDALSRTPPEGNA